MKFTPKKVFVLAEGHYQEISREEHERRRESDEAYANKHFLLIHGYLMEVERKDYIHFHKEKRRQKYIDESAAENGVISYDALVAGDNIVVDSGQDVVETVTEKMLQESLYKAIDLLPDDERRLIMEHFFLGISQTDLALIYDVDQSTISRRLGRIVEKLGKIMKI